MSLSVTCLCVLLFCSLQVANAEYQRIVTGYNADSVIMDMTPGSLENGDEFGIKVDMWNGVAGITAQGRSLNSAMEVVRTGCVYLFSSSNSWSWSYTGTALRSDYSDDGFGLGLSIGDNLLAVGAPYDSRWGEYGTGAVYVYVGAAPTFTISTLFSEHREKEAYFGATVAIIRSGVSQFKNGAIVVGAPGHSHEGHKQVGAVFVYSKNYGSVFYQMNMMLEPSEMKEGGNMGYSMAVYGNTLAVGAPGANTVYLFELLLHVEECPHGHEEQQQLPPDSCVQVENHHRSRALQGGEGREGENRDREQQEREQQEREQHENHQVYYVWKYDQIVAFHLEDAQTYQNALFGSSVAVYNDTVLTVVVGAPGATSATTGYYDAGAVFILTVMHKSNIWANFVPDGYHAEGEDHHHLRKLQGGGGDHHEDERHHVTWDPMQNTVGWDSLGNFWLREAVLYGDTQGGKFGSALAADYNSLFVGSNNDNPLGYGGVKVYQRQATTVQDYDRPIISGPLFKMVFLLTGTLADTQGNQGDKFGSSLALYQDQALVGSYLQGLSSVTAVGTGAAYMYNRINYVFVTPSPSAAPTGAAVTSSWFFLSEDGHINMAAAVQISSAVSLVLLASVMAVYGVYKYRGGKVEATVVFAASWKSVKEFGSSVATQVSSKLPWGGESGSDKARTSLSLSDISMDDSTSSQSPMNSNYMNSSHGSSTSSSSSSSGFSNGGSSSGSGHPGRFQPHQGTGSQPGPGRPVRGGFRPQQPPGQPRPYPQGQPQPQPQGYGLPRQPPYSPQAQPGQYRPNPGSGPGSGSGYPSQPHSPHPRPDQYQRQPRPTTYGASRGKDGAGSGSL